MRIAAVLGDRFSLVDLATVSGGRAVDLVEQLTPAVRARLLIEDGNALVFRHELVHDAIYQDIPAAGRLAMHREAARVLAGAGAPPAEVAAHVLRGSGPGDLWAVGRLLAAARQALPRAPDVAVEMLSHAERLAPADHPDHDVVVTALVEALLRAGRVAESARYAETALAGLQRAGTEARLRRSLVEALSLQNRPDELIHQAEAALAGTATLSAADRALILAQASFGRTFSGDLVGGEESARAAVELARRCGDTGMTVWSLTTLAFAVKTQGRYGEALDLTRQAVHLASSAADESGRLRHPHFFHGMALCDADRTVEAREAYRIGVDECAELRSSWILPDIQQLTGELHLLVGEWDDALVELEAGLTAAAERGNRVAVAQSRGYLGLLHVAAGDLRAARAVLAPLSADGAGASRYGAEVAAYARAVLAEAQGRPEHSVAVLRSAWRRAVDGRARRCHRLLGPPLVRLALSLDQAAVAAEVADEVAEAARAAPDVPSVAAAALRCRALVERCPATMSDAVDLLRASPRLLDRTATYEDAALLLGSAGRADEARSLLGEALTHYEEWGARAWAARARAALRGLGARPGVRGPRRRPAAGWDSLTTTERAVARLVAEGLTNREVGERMHISAHTVNTHLRHLFQKLAVSSRTGLTAALLSRTGAEHHVFE